MVCLATAREPVNGLYLGPTFGNRPRLIKDYGVDVPCSLETLCVAYEDTLTSSSPDAHHDRCRRSETQSARTGNNQYRDSRYETLLQPSMGKEDEP